MGSFSIFLLTSRDTLIAKLLVSREGGSSLISVSYGKQNNQLNWENWKK
jgi:hypothetical protein